MLKSLAAALLAAPLLAAACERYEVKVLPFEPAVNTGTPAARLTEMNGGKPTVGMVRVYYSAMVQGCTLTLGYRNPQLYVAREMAANQCAFEHVMEHEQEHVAIYRRSLATLAERVQARLTPAADLMAIVEQELDHPRAEHAAHDSPEEYARNASVCDGRVARLSGFRRF